MSLTIYCEFDEIRAALGVNITELSDTVLALPVYEMGMVRELNKLSTSLNAAFSVVRLQPPGTRTPEGVVFFETTRLFAVYAAAKQAGVSLANFAPKDIGDGKASISRFAGEPYERTMERVETMYAALRGELKLAYEAFAGVSSGLASTVPSVFFVASSPTYDPVTG